jgi:PPM family protein phosphatase
MLSLDIATLTKQGSRRYQEDNFGETQVAGVGCLIVADGAGGHGGGHIASELAVRASLDAFAQHPEYSAERLHQTLLHAHRVVKAGQQKFERYPDMRSTLVIALIELATGRVMLGNIGDSRGYSYVSGEVSRTRDHTIMQQMIDAGMYKEGEAPRSRVTSTLMASLGSADDPLPFVIELPKRCSAGDCFLLCTDGWWDTLDPTNLLDTLQPEIDLTSALAALEGQLLLQASADQDNYTAMLVRVGGEVQAPKESASFDAEGTVPISAGVAAVVSSLLGAHASAQPPGWDDTVVMPQVLLQELPHPPSQPPSTSPLNPSAPVLAVPATAASEKTVDFDQTVVLKREPASDKDATASPLGAAPNAEPNA